MNTKNNRPPFLLLAAFSALAYAAWLRPRLLRWGASENEITQPLAGDDAAPTAQLQSTRSVNIQARPEDVFPWLLQIGYQRAGWYSYDFLEKAIGVGDFADGASANRIIPELQDLKVGDAVRTDPDGGFTVTALEPNRLLLLEAVLSTRGKHFELNSPIRSQVFSATWSFNLIENEQGGTRMVSRFRCAFPRNLEYTLFAYLLLEPSVFLMERRMLLGIKERVEKMSRGKLRSNFHQVPVRVTDG